MAEAVTNRGTYLPALADLAWRICEESAWQLPAHNSYIPRHAAAAAARVNPANCTTRVARVALIATVCGLLGRHSTPTPA